MIQLKKLLLESSSETEVISKDEAKRLYYNEASNFDLEKDQYIFRGISGLPKDTKYAKVDPSSYGMKTAKMGTSYHYLVMNYSEPWKEYPDREVICSTSDTYANQYGSLFLVVPFNGADWGICPGPSNWVSFPRVTKELESDKPDPRVFNEFVKDACGQLLGNIPSQESFSDLVNALDEVGRVSEEMKQRGLREKTNLMDKYDPLMKSWLITTIGAKYDTFSSFIFDWVMSPDRNGFEYQESWNGTGSDQEIWTDSPCLFIRARMVDSTFGRNVSKDAFPDDLEDSGLF